MQAERWASTEFDRYMRHAISKHFEPTRYEIKEVER